MGALALTADPLTRVTFTDPKRSTDQNRLLWAKLSEIAEQKDYHGLTLTPEDWKTIFVSALHRELRVVPDLDGRGFITLGASSSGLTRAEFSDLLALIDAWASQNGVHFADDGTEQRGSVSSAGGHEASGIDK